MRRENVDGTVYLLHFDRPYGHAKHYTGWTTDLESRLADHRSGNGARLMAVIREAGIGFSLARTWTGTRSRERQLKREGGAARRCPMCGVTPRREPDPDTPEDLRAVVLAARRDIAARRAERPRTGRWGPPLPQWARAMPAAELDQRLAQIEDRWNTPATDRRRTR
ncbi:hypothetical protein [Nocardia sp. CC227C]|uniref:hypothetical protein n=1 Tax=Nocardia sp. CC227C TaxID=3044562 RepID=UPI00278C5488|nr:hypothetical protein [Nocardia sp. CC227C]